MANPIINWSFLFIYKYRFRHRLGTGTVLKVSIWHRYQKKTKRYPTLIMTKPLSNKEHNFARTYSHHYEMIDVYHYLCSLIVKKHQVFTFYRKISPGYSIMGCTQTHACTVIKHEINYIIIFHFRDDMIMIRKSLS